MTAYYNEIDPFAAAWLRELIKAGLIAPGDVDERSIEDVAPDDLAPYTQAHFFAGIGGWSYALRLTGWPDDWPIWTGSCPCQPFSAAGKGGGLADERHLWPAWFWLIRQCRPSVLLGEQVSSKAGRAWFGVVSSDLEAHGYAVGAADLCAASVGAPHVRQRLWFVAHTNGDERSTNGGESNARTNGGGNSRILANAEDRRQAGIQGGDCKIGSSQAYRNSRQSGHWSDCDWLPCRDGKARPAESGIAPLAHGVPARVGRLRGYGNAIVPQVAAEFVKAYLDCGK